MRDVVPAATTRTTLRVGSRTCELIDVAVAFGLLEGGLWSIGLAQLVWAVTLITWVSVASVRSGRDRNQLGIGLKGISASLWVIPASLAFAFFMMLLGSYAGTLHDLRGAHAPLWHSVLYVVWALVQEFLTQSFIFVWLESILENSRWAVLATAFLFCVAHIPNPVLMVATLAMGLVWAELFRRYRNIYPLAVGHAILGLSLSVTIPEAVSHHMRVGLACWK